MFVSVLDWKNGGRHRNSADYPRFCMNVRTGANPVGIGYGNGATKALFRGAL